MSIDRFALALGGGAAIGVFFVGGLWLTVRYLPTARFPALLTLASFLARTLLSMAALYVISGQHWPQLLVAVVGFMATQAILTWRLGLGQARPRPVHKEMNR